ncbi:MAG: hypothetical protein IT285_13035 [Bdellovibrionales bacterium]|nr:hypothetical protein [Bdellovibrionales bacterium]
MTFLSRKAGLWMALAGIALFSPVAQALTEFETCMRSCRYQYKQWEAHCMMDDQNTECMRQAQENYDQCRAECQRMARTSPGDPAANDADTGRIVPAEGAAEAVGNPAAAPGAD